MDDVYKGIELRPGVHDIEVLRSRWGLPSGELVKYNTRVKFTAEAGHTYLIEKHWPRYSWVTDTADGRLVGGEMPNGRQPEGESALGPAHRELHEWCPAWSLLRQAACGEPEGLYYWAKYREANPGWKFPGAGGAAYHAYIEYSLAARAGYPGADAARDRVALGLTAEQIRSAQVDIDEWRPMSGEGFFETECPPVYAGEQEAN
jgi:hypothetical protein